MPNHVTNKMTFDATSAEMVFAQCCPDGRFNFSTLIPEPAHIYHGNLSADDRKDFPCNWLTWSSDNWGTKWNAYSCEKGVIDGKAFIQFDTAWSPPYPVMAAFANRFQIPFEHRYFDEGHNFWGIDTWGCELHDDHVWRTGKRYSLPEDEDLLRIELKGGD